LNYTLKTKGFQGAFIDICHISFRVTGRENNYADANVKLNDYCEITSAHPEMANLPDIGVARKI